MVISTLTISFPASLPGEAQELKTKATAMPASLWSCAWGQSLPLPGTSVRRAERGEEEKLGCVAPGPST